MTDQLPVTISRTRHAVPALVAAAGDEHNSNPNLSRRSSVVRDHSVLNIVKTENPRLESRRKFGASMR